MQPAKRSLALLPACLLAVGAVAVTVPAAQAASKPAATPSQQSWMNLQLANQQSGPGASCEVPTTDGGTMLIDVVALTDTSKRMGTVRYVASARWSGVAPLELGTGAVTVTRVEGSIPTGAVLAERRGPAKAKAHPCYWGNWAQSMQLQVVHMQPVQRPSRETLVEWCGRFSPAATCPTELAAQP
jgi:hypothetical protein